MNQEPEILALSNVFEALKGLDRSQVNRIVDWVTDKFGISAVKRLPEVGPGTIPATPSPVEPLQPVPPVQPVQVIPAEPPVKAVKAGKPAAVRRGRRPAGAAPTAPAPLPPAAPVELEGFKRFDLIEDVFVGAKVKTISAKILLIAAYLQEKQGFKEFTSFDINSGMKKIGHYVQNISASINTLLFKKPPQLIQVGKVGKQSQFRRKYRITEEGLRLAHSYISQ